MKFIEFNEHFIEENYQFIGIDEVGVGDYFGPLVAAAVYIPKENIQKIISLGVKDSKKLTDKDIVNIASKIKELTINSAYVLSPKSYNSLTSTYNANELKMFTHLSALEEVLNNNVEYDYIFIDKYSTTKSIEKYWKIFTESNKIRDFNIVAKDVVLANKAEDICLPVACASILARDAFLKKMQLMNQYYSIEFPLGASNQVKMFAKELWLNRPDIEPNKVCKTSFKMDI
ncbi:ribonuclease HIII [Mycoplasma simbae]|uniref:ribonuclease HIII n=1 Tax=Mycoplasma simbae TaxID=36744 RepID=UPI000497CE36|nr:ribonuclease HIII [Mycoplasma simbae]